MDGGCLFPEGALCTHGPYDSFRKRDFFNDRVCIADDMPLFCWFSGGTCTEFEHDGCRHIASSLGQGGIVDEDPVLLRTEVGRGAALASRAARKGVAMVCTHSVRRVRMALLHFFS